MPLYNDAAATIQTGGQSPSGPLEFGTNNDQDVHILAQAQPRIMIVAGGNMGLNSDPSPDVPLMIGGGAWINN